MTESPLFLPIVWHEAYEIDLGPHVYPTAKYRLVKEQLLAEGTIAQADVRRPEPAGDADLLLVHDPAYVERIVAGRFSPEAERLLEVPFSPALRTAARLAVGGTMLAGRLARERGMAVHVGGGFHHAFADHGEGFCLLNDVAIAIRALQQEGTIRRAAVIDADVHHGNGTAAIFAGDPDVFTLSIHQEYNYPAMKPPSDRDIGLEDRAGDDRYLAQLRRHLPEVFEWHHPDLVFYLAGADPYRDDQLGGLALTLDGLRERDALVIGAAARARSAVAVTLAGGYARRLADTVEIHCGTVRTARRLLEELGPGYSTRSSRGLGR
jgi:acetoin utilization deacetylase AcuC-like enzyme